MSVMWLSAGIYTFDSLGRQRGRICIFGLQLLVNKASVKAGLKAETSARFAASVAVGHIFCRFERERQLSHSRLGELQDNLVCLFMVSYRDLPAAEMCMIRTEVVGF